MNEEVATLEDLAGAIIAYDPAYGSKDRDRILAALHHHHLPMLADAGLITYDARSETVRYVGDPTVERLLETLSDLSCEN